MTGATKDLPLRAAADGVPFFATRSEIVYDVGCHTHFDLVLKASGASLDDEDVVDLIQEWYRRHRPRGSRFTIRAGTLRLLWPLSAPMPEGAEGTEVATRERDSSVVDDVVGALAETLRRDGYDVERIG